MKKLWTYSKDNLEKKIRDMISEMEEQDDYIEVNYIELNNETKKDIIRSGCSDLLSDYRIIINNLLHERAIRIVGANKTLTRGLIDCINKVRKG
jgi:hypothetical protein